jgi:hypothetical protein
MSGKTQQETKPMTNEELLEVKKLTIASAIGHLQEINRNLTVQNHRKLRSAQIDCIDNDPERGLFIQFLYLPRSD